MRCFNRVITCKKEPKNSINEILDKEIEKIMVKQNSLRKMQTEKFHKENVSAYKKRRTQVFNRSMTPLSKRIEA